LRIEERSPDLFTDVDILKNSISVNAWLHEINITRRLF